MPARITYRGELRCFTCARYLGDFESHPGEHGARDIHLVEPEVELGGHAIQTERGLRCSVCGGRVLAEQVDRFAA
jgi:DNA-directed RNA polymerase subunit RPC12/RpoP